MYIKYCSVCIYKVNDQYKVSLSAYQFVRTYTMQVRILMCCSFFFCLVCMVACYTLSRKEKTKLIRGGIGTTWERNLYMGTQNGSKNEI